MALNFFCLSFVDMQLGKWASPPSRPLPALPATTTGTVLDLRYLYRQTDVHSKSYGAEINGLKDTGAETELYL